MPRITSLLALGALVMTLGCAQPAPAPEEAPDTVAATETQACDRACLDEALDGVLAAMLAHDPAAAPLADSFRYTENAVEVTPGEGLWASATALGAVQRKYLDPGSGQAAYFGLIEHGDGLGIATLRIRVEDGAVTEGELVLGGPTDGLFDPDGLAAAPPPDGPLAPELRSSREDMMAAANSYFDGLTTNVDEAVHAIPGCVRIENGVQVTGMRPGRDGGPPVDRGDCSNMAGMTQISGVSSRRFPVVDEEAGVVIGMGVFERPAGAARADGTLWPRNLLTEPFAVENGRIRSIYAAMHYMTPDLPDAPGW